MKRCLALLLILPIFVTLNSMSLTKEGLGIDLVQASKAGNIRTVKSLLDRGAPINYEIKPIDVHAYFESWDKGNALTMAIEHGHLDLVDFLAKKGANLECRIGYSGSTPLMLAVEKEDEKIVEILLRHMANPNSRDNYGNTAIILAAGRGNLDTIKVILDHGADIRIMNTSGEDSMVIARGRGYAELMGLLEPYYGSRPTQAKLSKVTLDEFLIKAAERNNIDLSKELLDMGASVNPYFDHYEDRPHGKRSPLAAAVENGNLALVTLLIAHGADVNIPCEAPRKMILSVAKSKKNLDARIVKLLIENGAELEYKPKTRWCPCLSGDCILTTVKTGGFLISLILISAYNSRT